MEKTQKWKSQFMIVALGQAVSTLGSHGVQFALIWWLAEKTSAPVMLGISGLVAYLPMTLFSPLAGIAADRYNRKFISIFSDMAMGAVALIYAGLLFFFDLPVWTVFVIPLTAYMQETISPEKMGRAFSVLTLISSVTMPIGLLFSSPIAEKVGVNVWFFISGLCMIILTACVSIRYSAKCRR